MNLRARSAIFAIVVLASAAKAGPPFVTDDPDPVDYRHWEVYIASQGLHDPSGGSFTAPQLEANYGALPNLQLHVIAMTELDEPAGGSRPYGYSTTELGAKYRLVEESASVPEIGIFPLVEVPGGNSSRGLGSPHTPVYLPLWLQKTFGKWTTYGGGGYWFNPGPGNRGYWFTGIVVQRQVRENLAIGLEVFHQTSQQIAAKSTTNTNLGFVWDLSETEHIMASAGPTIQGASGYETYVAIQWTFGPKESPPAKP